MGSQKRYSKELKIEVCEKYRNGEGGSKSIAKEIVCHNETLR